MSAPQALLDRLTPRQRLARALVTAPAARGARVKLCGMSRPQDVEAVNQARPDLCGFVVDFPRSHRSVGADGLPGLTCLLDQGIPAVGVFVDEQPRVVAGLADSGAIDVVQLHGHEDAAYLAGLRQLTGVAIIQAFRVRTPADLDAARASQADLVLLDNGQGSGAGFDWSLLAAGVGRPFILAGGLGPGNVAQAIEALGTGELWGVDMSSGIETGGLKDKDKMIAAVAAVRSAR